MRHTYIADRVHHTLAEEQAVKSVYSEAYDGLFKFSMVASASASALPGESADYLSHVHLS